MTDDITTTLEGDSLLSDEQRARGEALGFARMALADSHTSAFGSRDSIPKRFGSTDLMDMGQWVIDGTDPMVAYREATKPATIIVVPDDQVERISELNRSNRHMPNGLLLLPESAVRIEFKDGQE